MQLKRNLTMPVLTQIDPKAVHNRLTKVFRLSWGLKNKSELLPLGGNFLAHNPASGAIVLTNAFGAGILRQFAKEGIGVTYDRTSAELLSVWEHAGLFAGHRCKPKDFIGISDAPPSQALSFRVGDRSVVVDIYDNSLADQLACILKNVLIDIPSNKPADLIISCSENAFSVYENGVATSEILNRDQARWRVIGLLAERLLGSNSVAAVLHASAVAKNGRCVILSGESGRGKTTTALSLLNAGCIQVADDHVPLDKSGEDVLAFPAAIGTKSGIWNIAAVASLLGTSAKAEKVRDGVRYVHAKDRAEPGARLPVAAIILPHFDPSTKFDLEPISPEGALLELISAGGRPSHGLSTLAPLVHLLNTVPTYKMHYRSSDQSVPACLSLLEGK